MVSSVDSGESGHSYTKENDPRVGGSGSLDPKNLVSKSNPGLSDSSSDIEEVGSI